MAAALLPDALWVVERTFAWLNQFRRLRVRDDKRADIHEAFLSLGGALICWPSLRQSWMMAGADDGNGWRSSVPDVFAWRI